MTTPGPWRVDPIHKCDIQTADGSLEIATTAFHPGDPCPTPSIETCWENATLLAAAPRMSYALRCIYSAAQSLQESEDAPPGPLQDIQKMVLDALENQEITSPWEPMPLITPHGEMQ